MQCKRLVSTASCIAHRDAMQTTPFFVKRVFTAIVLYVYLVVLYIFVVTLHARTLAAQQRTRCPRHELGVVLARMPWDRTRTPGAGTPRAQGMPRD